MGWKALGIIVLFLFLLATPVSANSETVGEISDQLVCQCGCGRLLNSHVCDTQEAMVTLIEQKLAQGQSAEQIIQFFVAQYGEQVLASPPKQGFNLVAWVLPFAAILGGGGVIYMALKAWVRQGKIHRTDAIAEAEEGDEQYQRQLEKELKEFTERGFR